MSFKYTDAVFKAELPMRDKVVLWVLAYRAHNESGECWPSYSTIASDAGTARSTAEKAVNRLIDHWKVVSIVGRKQLRPDKKVNVYRLDLSAIESLASTARRYSSELEPIPGDGTGVEPIPGDGTGPVPRDGGASTAARYLTRNMNSSELTRQADADAYASAALVEDEDRPATRENLGETPNPRTQGRPLATPVKPKQASVPVQQSTETPGSAPPPEQEDNADRSGADSLAAILHRFFSVRDDIEIPAAWERFWVGDFRKALGFATYSQLELAIFAAQLGKARTMYKTARGICNQVELLNEQAKKYQKIPGLIERMYDIAYRNGSSSQVLFWDTHHHWPDELNSDCSLCLASCFQHGAAQCQQCFAEVATYLESFRIDEEDV